MRGLDAAATAELDVVLRALDGTTELCRLGANAVLAVSLAAALAAARQAGVPLFRWLAADDERVVPLPMVNVFSGGAHAARAVDLQDVLFVPVAAGSVAEAMEAAVAVRAAAARRLRRLGHPAALVADEGGLAAPLRSNREAVELVAAAIEDAGLAPEREGAIAVDVAATQLLDDGRYVLRAEGRELDSEELVGELATWCRQLPIVSIEDPVAEDDAAGWPPPRGTCTASRSSATTSSRRTRPAWRRGSDANGPTPSSSSRTRTARSVARSTCSGAPARPATRPSFRRARARPRTRGS